MGLSNQEPKFTILFQPGKDCCSFKKNLRPVLQENGCFCGIFNGNLTDYSTFTLKFDSIPDL